MGLASDQMVDDFIRVVLINNLRKMVYDAELSYLAVGNITVGIEFLGACIDADDFAVDGKSKQRFAAGIDQFMAKVNPKYRVYNQESSPFFLYKQVRCGMAHLVRPQGKVAFDGREDANKHGLAHLEIHAPKDKLILVVEDFFDDFTVACEDMRKLLPTLPYPKLKEIFLPVWEP